MKTIAWLLVLVALIAGPVWYFKQPSTIAVRLHRLDQGSVRATVANTRVGTVEACDRAQMSPAAPGQVAKLNVREGARVDKDDILLEIWNDDRKAELRLAEAEVRAARSRASEVCATSAGAEREAKRLQKLRERKLISEEAVDNAATEAEARAAACAAGLAATRVSAANIAVAREAVERTLLRAPFSGIVAEVDVRLGEYLTPSPPGIATLPAIDLIDPSCIFVAAPIDEVDAPTIAVGMPACVSLDAFKERFCDAEVRRIAPYVRALEKQARTVEVEVEIHNGVDVARLLPGYSADIEILIKERNDVVRVPSEAIVEGNKVFVFDEATSRLRLTSFEAGISNWEFTESIDGLGVGALIVLSVGREGVADGALVVDEAAIE